MAKWQSDQRDSYLEGSKEVKEVRLDESRGIPIDPKMAPKKNKREKGGERAIAFEAVTFVFLPGGGLAGFYTIATTFRRLLSLSLFYLYMFDA